MSLYDMLGDWDDNEPRAPRPPRVGFIARVRRALERARQAIARAFDVDRHEGCGGELDYWGRGRGGAVRMRCKRCGEEVTIAPKF